jgi:hypothetical protein
MISSFDCETCSRLSCRCAKLLAIAAAVSSASAKLFCNTAQFFSVRSAAHFVKHCSLYASFLALFLSLAHSKDKDEEVEAPAEDEDAKRSCFAAGAVAGCGITEEEEQAEAKTEGEAFPGFLCCTEHNFWRLVCGVWEEEPLGIHSIKRRTPYWHAERAWGWGWLWQVSKRATWWRVVVLNKGALLQCSRATAQRAKNW